MNNFNGYNNLGYPAQNVNPSIITVPINDPSQVNNYAVAAGNIVNLIDFNNKVFYLKSTDQNGIANPLRIFDFSERIPEQPQQSSEFVTKKEFEDLSSKIDKLLEELT